MEANDRTGVLRRLIDAELKPLGPTGRELAALRWHLREPIDESGPPDGQRAAGDTLALHSGRSWGP